MNCLNNSLVEGGAGAGARAGAGVRARDTAKEEVGVLLSLVGAPDRSSASLSSLPGERLRQMLRRLRGLAI